MGRGNHLHFVRASGNPNCVCNRGSAGLNTQAMRREYQLWAKSVTGKSETYAEFGPMWDIWHTAWKAAFRVRNERKPLTDDKIWWLHIIAKSPLQFARLIEDQHGIKFE